MQGCAFISASTDAGRILNLTLANGGGTFSGSRTFDPGFGYIVAFPVNGRRDGARIPLRTSADVPDAISHIETMLELAGEDGLMLGTWMDDNGDLVIDYVEHVGDRGLAMLKGSLREQVAIWDCAKKESIYL